MSMQQVTQELIELLKKHRMCQYVTIYTEGTAISLSPDGSRHVSDCPDPRKYFDYANHNTIAASFEGPLYHDLNYGAFGETPIQKAMNELFERHGYYYELGNAWNFSLFTIGGPNA